MARTAATLPRPRITRLVFMVVFNRSLYCARLAGVAKGPVARVKGVEVVLVVVAWRVEREEALLHDRRAVRSVGMPEALRVAELMRGHLELGEGVQAVHG